MSWTYRLTGFTFDPTDVNEIRARLIDSLLEYGRECEATEEFCSYAVIWDMADEDATGYGAGDGVLDYEEISREVCARGGWR